MLLWHRLVIVTVVIVATAVIARVVDWRMARRQLSAESATRYRVLRRSITTALLVVGILSALLVIPQVRAVAGGLLASSAVLGVIIGFASQRTLGNFVAGILIAITQPLRLGDVVKVGGVEGTVEEIGLTFTFIRTPENVRLVIPNEKLASDTIENSTIVSREKLAQITVQVPLSSDLQRVVELLRELVAGEREGAVLVTDLAGSAAVTVRAWAPDTEAAKELASELRIRAHERLREAGVYA
jgi:small-conductance mechanosensitive channel